MENDDKITLMDGLNRKAQSFRLDKRDYASAIIYYTKVIEIKADYEFAYARRGMCKGAMKDYKGQIQDYTKVIEFEPTSQHYLSRAYVKSKIKDHIGAIEDCTTAIYIDNLNFSAFQERGENKLKLNDFIEAINDLNSCISIKEKFALENEEFNPRYWSDYISRGQAKLAIEDFEGALNDFTFIINLTPVHPLAYKHRASVKLRSGDINGYEQDFTLFLQKDSAHQKKWGVSFKD